MCPPVMNTSEDSDQNTEIDATQNQPGLASDVLIKVRPDVETKTTNAHDSYEDALKGITVSELASYAPECLREAAQGSDVEDLFA